MFRKGMFQRVCAVVVATVFLVSVSGCSQSVSVSVSGSAKTGVTGTITYKISWSQQEKGVPASDFAVSQSAGYTAIVNAPSADFALDSQNQVQTTLTATTDRGYTSSVTVTLQPVASTTAPVASGDTVYTFALQNTTALNSWVQAVQQNMTSSVTINSSTGAVFDTSQNAGTYTLNVQVNSTQTGMQPIGSVSYADPGPPDPSQCTHSPCYIQP